MSCGRPVLFLFNVAAVRTAVTSVCASSFLSPLRVFTSASVPLYHRRRLHFPSPCCAPVAQPVMRHHRHRTPVTSRRTSRNSSSPWTTSIQNTWRNASSNERFAIIVASFAAVAFAGTVINVVFHISLFLAVAAVSLVAAPLLFLVMLSFTAFTAGVLMTTGFGFLLFGAPIFTVGLMAKMIVPLLAFVGAVSFIASRILPSGEPPERVSDPIEQFEEQDEFERFDDTLKTRVTGHSAIDVESWGLNEVVDELDFSGLGEYRQLFIEERIDGHTLLSLSDDDIKAEFGRTMPLGDRMRLIRLVERLRRRSSRLL